MWKTGSKCLVSATESPSSRNSGFIWVFKALSKTDWRNWKKMTRFTLLACAILMFVLVCIHRATSTCDTVWKGCTLEEKHCTCTERQGCENPFEYDTLETCLDAVFGDVCKHYPCLNNGVCSQVKDHDYTCKCSGTGYYGTNCEIECPSDLSSIPKDMWNLGKACVKI